MIKNISNIDSTLVNPINIPDIPSNEKGFTFVNPNDNTVNGIPINIQNIKMIFLIFILFIVSFLTELLYMLLLQKKIQLHSKLLLLNSSIILHVALCIAVLYHI